MADDVAKLKEKFDRVHDSDEYEKRRTRWRRYLREYMGEWWDPISDAFESKAVINYLFSTIETNAPLLTDNKPMWTVLARWPHQQGLADNLTKASRALWDKLDLDMKLLHAVKDAQLFGTALFKVYFSPDKDELMIELIDPATFVLEPGYDDLWDASWMGQKRRLPLNWLKKVYPDKAKEIESSEAQDETEDGIWNRDDIELEEKFVTVYEIWERDDSVEDIEEIDDEGNTQKRKQAKYPNGRIRTFTKENILLEDKASPFNHGKPPYVALHDYPVPHRFWSMGEADQLEDLIREQNLRFQHVVDTARKYDKKNFIISSDAGISPAKFKNAMRTGDELLVANSEFTKDMLAEIPPPSLDTATMSLLEAIPHYIEEISGVTDVTKGTIGKKQRQSASEISVLIESSYTRTRQRVRNLEWSIKRMLELLIELMQQYYVEPRPYQTKRDEEVEYGYMSNDPNFVLQQMKPNVPDVPDEELHPEDRQMMQDYRMLVEDFAGQDSVHIDFELQIDTNSTLPLDKQSLANLAIRLAEMKILPREAILDVLRFPNKDRYLRIIEEEKQEAAQRKQGQPQGKPPGQPQGMPQAAQRQMEGR